MKQPYTSSSETLSLKKLAFFTLLVGLIYAGMFYFLPDHHQLISSQNKSQIISKDSLFPTQLNTPTKVLEMFPSNEKHVSSNNRSSHNDEASYQEGSQTFRFLGAILQLLLNLYRI